MCVQRAELGPLRVDRRIAEVAVRQYGVVTRAQLRTAGLSDPAITRRVQGGRLHRVHRRVFSVATRCSEIEGGSWRRCSPEVVAPS